MKIFPLRPMSNYDRIKNIYNIICNKIPIRKQNLGANIVGFGENKSLKKGRSICDMLSE